jgi:alpha-mannosidase
MSRARRWLPSLAVLVAVAALIASAPAWAHDRPGYDPASSVPARARRVAGTRAGSAGSLGSPRGGVVPTRVWPFGVGAPARERYYLADDDHTDYMWSALDTTYRSAFVRMLDHAMDLSDATALDPWDERGRFTMDGTVWAREYEATQGAERYGRLVQHLRDSSLTMPLNTCVQLYGAMPAEAVLRSFYDAGRRERRHGLRFSLVIPMEDQTLPGGVASLWAGSGARYAWKGVCDCATSIDATDRPRDVYRFVGPDGQGVIMKWNASYWGNRSIGGYAEAADPAAALELMKHDPTYAAHWPYEVHAAFGYGWDATETETDAFVQAARTLGDDTTRVISSNELDFFLDFESRYGGDLPSYGKSFGNEWELNTASMAEVTAQVKRSVEKLRTAEALASIATLFDSTFMNGRDAERDSMTMGCGLYYEHSWSAGPGVTVAEREDWQRQIQRAITRYVDHLYDDALARLGALIPGAPGTARYAVFNPLSWTRTDAADLPAGPVGSFHVVDVATGAEVPSQRVTVDGVAKVRIRAPQVPSVGYRLFDVVAGAGRSFPAAATVTNSTLDNGVYGITLDGGGRVTSFVDHKDGDRELVAPGGALHDPSFDPGSGTVVVEDAGPVSTALHLVAGGDYDHESRVTLFAGIDRAELEGRITQNFGSATIAYGSTFDLPGAAIRHEEVGMIARVARAADGGDYADENTRTDWLTLNHFVDLSQSMRGVTVSAWDSPYFQTGSSTATELDATTPTIRCLTGMSIPLDGVPSDQGGDRVFLQRYALRTHGTWDQAAAMRFALEHQNPLVATAVNGVQGSQLPIAPWSLVTIDTPDVVLWALKPAEDGAGAGLVARVWNVADSPRAATLSLPLFTLADARHVTHIETDLGPAWHTTHALSASLARQQMITWRLLPIPPTGGAGGRAAEIAFVLSPNPVARATPGRIAWTMPDAGHARIAIYDLRGARVALLADGEMAAGPKEMAWAHAGARPGVYFVRLGTAGRTLTRRWVVLE